MYEATCTISRKNSKEGLSYVLCGDDDNAYNYLKAFDFILILHPMKEITRIINIVCQALQQQSRDVVNAMNLLCTTKSSYSRIDRKWFR